jgi:hypothetical protein
MSSTGVSTQHAESEKRFMETINAKPSEAILFRAATQQQVLSAVAEEELARISANIILAKQ